MIRFIDDDRAYSWMIITVELNNYRYVTSISHPRTSILLVNSWILQSNSLIVTIDNQIFLLDWWNHPSNCSYYYIWAISQSRFPDKNSIRHIIFYGIRSYFVVGVLLAKTFVIINCFKENICELSPCCGLILRHASVVLELISLWFLYISGVLWMDEVFIDCNRRLGSNRTRHFLSCCGTCFPIMFSFPTFVTLRHY